MIRVTTAPTATPAALVTATVRAQLDATAADDTAIEALIQEATRMGEEIAPRPWVYREYEERIIPREVKTWLYLVARPLSSVTSVAFGTNTAIDEGTDADEFAVWPTALYREDGWDTGEPGWLIKYFAGYDLPSSDDPAPTTAASIDREGLAVRGAIFQIVQATWTTNPAIKRFKKDSAETEFFGDVTVPPVAMGVLIREGGLVA